MSGRYCTKGAIKCNKIIHSLINLLHLADLFKKIKNDLFTQKLKVFIYLIIEIVHISDYQIKLHQLKYKKYFFSLEIPKL